MEFPQGRGLLEHGTVTTSGIQGDVPEGTIHAAATTLGKVTSSWPLLVNMLVVGPSSIGNGWLSKGLLIKIECTGKPIV